MSGTGTTTTTREDGAGAPVLLLGATGTVGQEVARALLLRGATARALVRSAHSEAALPRGIEPVRGDLRDPAALERALRGTRAAFYCSPHEPDEEELAARVVRACEAARARLVFVGVHFDGPNRAARALRRALYRFLLPHYAPKLRLSERVRRARTDVVVLMPANFYQNDELFRDEILAGVYSQPFGPRGINRVDVRDLGDAAARALTELEAVPPGAYPMLGPASLSGDACAAVWSAALGREVRYTGENLASWTASIAQQLSGKKRDDFLATYKIMPRLHVPTRPERLDVLGDHN